MAANDSKEFKDDEKKQNYPLIGIVPNAKEIEVDYDTISDKDLIEFMKKPSELLIIDVRDPDKPDGDFLGGNICGAVNIPSFDLVDKLPEIITEKNLEEKKTIVFLCMMSKGRGPQTYRLYNKAREALLKPVEKKDDNDEFNKIVSSIKLNDKSLALLQEQKIFVLKGGFHTFLNYHKDEKGLIENFDEDLWELTKLDGEDNDGIAFYHKNEP
eukprot:UN12134